MASNPAEPKPQPAEDNSEKAKAKKKPKKKKPAKETAVVPAEEKPKPKAAAPEEEETGNDEKDLEEEDTSFLRHPPKPELQDILMGSKTTSKVKTTKEEHDFWKTQPVLEFDEKSTESGPIEVKTVADVRKEPYSLPANYEWSTCDMNDSDIVDEVYNLLAENYVEDDDNMFRFDYSRDFLKWALKPPGYQKELHIGVRHQLGKKKLVGFITGVPSLIRVYQEPVKMVEINFLCVHKKLRNKRLAPVLIKEVTRRVNLTNVWQAVYTAGVVLPKPVAQNRYYHRSLNPKKLIDIGFSRLHPRLTLNRMIKLYRVPERPKTAGFRELQQRDVPAACRLLTAYLKKFGLVQTFTEDEFAHWFMPRAGVVNTYVVENSNRQITDMSSFYTLPSSIINNDKYSTLKAAYSFYNVSTKTPWIELITDTLAMAKILEFDVFNALNVMENEQFLKPLKFGIGDGHLQYYLYNWRCPEMKPSNVGLVLL